MKNADEKRLTVNAKAALVVFLHACVLVLGVVLHPPLKIDSDGLLP